MRAINGNTVQLSKNPFTSTSYFGALVIGTFNKIPTAKTILNTINISGIFIPNNGNYGFTTVSDSTSTIVYNGSKQNVAGGITYNNLVIKQTNATTATLSSSALVKGSFILQNGKLTTATTKLLTLDVDATFPTVAKDSFFVNGLLAKKFNSTNPFTFQIGSVSNNISKARSVVISPNTANLKTYTSAFVIGKVANNQLFDSTVISRLDSTSYYTVSVGNYDAGVDTSAKVGFQYRYDSSITNEPLLLSHYITPHFIVESSTLQSTNGPSLMFGNITTDNYNSTFGNYAFAFGIPYPLPVKFDNIYASSDGNGSIKVNWKSLNEMNASKFVVESSADGISFTGKGVVIAKGAINYSFIDIQPYEGINYYRIKVLDHNGTVTYSSIAVVKAIVAKATLTVYPNPVTGRQLSFVINNRKGSASYKLKLTDILGKTVFSKQIQQYLSNTTYKILLPFDIHPGTYFIELSEDNNIFGKTIIVE